MIPWSLLTRKKINHFFKNVLTVLFFTFFLYFKPLLAEKSIDAKIEKHKNITCVNYQIEPKKTLYFLSKKIFDVSINDMIEFNPGIEIKFQAGNNLYVPAIWIKDWSKIKIYHEVKSGQTLYSIGKTYQIEPEKIRKLNKIKKDNLPIGKKLLIPIENNDFAKTKQLIPTAPKFEAANENSLKTFAYIVKEDETLYSIAKKFQVDLLQLKKINQINDNFNIQVDQVILIPDISQQEREQMQKNNQQTNEITQNQNQDIQQYWQKNKETPIVTLVLSLDIELNKKFTEDTRNTTKKVHQKTENALRFFGGIQMALNEIKKQKINYKLQVIDGSKIKNIDDYQEIITQTDLFILALEENELDIWLEKLEIEKKLTIIAPYQGNFNPKIEKDSLEKPFLQTPYFTIAEQLDFAENYIRKKHPNDNVIVVLSERDTLQIPAFEKWAIETEFPLTLVQYPQLAWDTKLANNLSLSNKNLIFFVEEDMIWVSRFMTDFQRLRNQGFRDYKISLLGLETWIAPSDQIEEELKFELNYQFVSSKFLNKNNPKLKDFYKKFYTNFNADADDIGLFGYDLMQQIHQNYQNLSSSYEPYFLHFNPKNSQKSLFILEYSKENFSLKKNNLDN